MISIYYSLELVLNITAIIPCLILVILYLIDRNKLKSQNYFKLELMFSLIVTITLNFIKNYDEDDNEDENIDNIENENCDESYRINGLIKSYLEIVILCLLSCFNYLCYFLLKNKDKTKKLIIIIILSLISWLIPLYIFIIYGSKKEFTSISGVCIFSADIKKNIDLYLIPIIFLSNSIFFIMTLIELNKRKNKDENNSREYRKNMKRIGINFFCQFILFSIEYINNAFIFFEIDKNNRYKYYNIIYNIALTIISVACCFEAKTREYYNKFIYSCLKFEKIQKKNKNENEEEEEEEDEDDDDGDDDEDMKIYVELSTESDN